VMSPDRYAVISSLSLIVNQRLLRKLCSGCGGAGCERCLRTGFSGRIPVAEMVALDDSLRARIRDSGPSVIAPQPTLAEAALELVSQNKSNQLEFRRLFGNES